MRVRDASDAAVSQYIKEGFSSLSEQEQMLVAIWGLEGDVNNGGFDQYYFNSYGNYADRVIGYLKSIGAPNMARIVERANERFGPTGPPADRFERQEAMDQLPGRDDDLWGDLDAEFWKYPDDIEGLLARHLGLVDA